MAKLDALFKKMVQVKASDLHLTSTIEPMWRIHGDMVKDPELPSIQPDEMMEMLKEITPEDRMGEFISTGDLDFAYELQDVGRFRVNLFMDRLGPSSVFRIIPSEIITAEELGLSPGIVDLCKLPKGLVLVTGPTGSGKSTTLSAMIDFINRSRKNHIITIEDPIEFVHKNKLCLINQREISNHTESFKKALRASLREDPDIILIGEMRDLETTEIAIETAETGHLVFGTLHTSTAPSTVDRVIQQFPGDKQNQIKMMLSNSLKGVISQTLLKRADGRGRVAAMEVLINTPAVGNMIRDGKIHQILSVMQTSSKDGMVILNDVLANYVKQGTVTKDEALSKAIDKNGLASKLTMY